MGDGAHHAARGMRPHHVVDVPELLDRVLVLETPEITQNRVGIENLGKPPAGVGQAKAVARIFRCKRPGFQRVD